ncbi:Arc-like DNA binding dprotein [Comamonas sp. BIGb0124]|uniref:Arc family DNA-binding protein n=1 Tax=Comamonas sp. BIGb0124 TaxID=2485130 RepID=UPI000F46F7AA|nr:Arc family DNA-binding protein [Comamonas sp. BIGb0124]ROR26563.1 Arc-like DNA binding dprotein [Comamonas sp. BIGb0124]
MTEEKSGYPSDVADKVLVRLPDGMRDGIKDAAKANGRTMNAEIVARLDTSFTATETSSEILSLIATLQFELSQARYREQVQLTERAMVDEIVQGLVQTLAEQKFDTRLIKQYNQLERIAHEPRPAESSLQELARRRESELTVAKQRMDDALVALQRAVADNSGSGSSDSTS